MVVCKSPGQRRVWPGATTYPFTQPRLRRSQPRSKPPGFGLLIVRPPCFPLYYTTGLGPVSRGKIPEKKKKILSLTP